MRTQAYRECEWAVRRLAVLGRANRSTSPIAAYLQQRAEELERQLTEDERAELRALEVELRQSANQGG